MKRICSIALLCIFLCSQVTCDLLDGLDHHNHHHHHDHDDHDDLFDDLDFRDDDDDDDDFDDDDSFEDLLLKRINSFLPRNEFGVSKAKSLGRFAFHSDEQFNFDKALSQLIPDLDSDEDDRVIVVDIDAHNIGAPKFNFQPPPKPAAAPTHSIDHLFQFLPAVDPTPAPLLTNFLPEIQRTLQIEHKPFGIAPERNTFVIKNNFGQSIEEEDDRKIIVFLDEPTTGTTGTTGRPLRKLIKTTSRPQKKFFETTPRPQRKFTKATPPPQRKFTKTTSRPQKKVFETTSRPQKKVFDITPRHQRKPVATTVRPQRKLIKTTSSPKNDLSGPFLVLDNDYDDYSDNSIGRQLEQRETPKAPNSFDLLDGEYPTFAVVPRTTFDCGEQNLGGYYADLEADCQVFHICLEGGLMGSFLCPNGTLFNQKYFVCDWWFNVDCSQAPQSYGLNARIGVVPDNSIEYYDE